MAFTSSCSRTPTLPKSCRSAAYPSSISSSRLRRNAPYGPVVVASTTFASATVRFATRKEWPEVVGSRDSIAVTDALTKPSNSCRIDS